MMRTLVAGLLIALLACVLSACADVFSVGTRVTLLIPDNFRGEVFVISDDAHGLDWSSGRIAVPPNGIVAVKSLARLASIAPPHFSARYANGEALGNSVLRTGEEISLWPLDNVRDELLYFVVGTFHEKTEFENRRMMEDWSDTLKTVRARRGLDETMPNKAPDRTAPSVTPPAAQEPRH